MLLLILAVGTVTADEPKKPRYTTRLDHDPNGIGKFYKGREIAYVMGHQASGWLDRKEREKEEEPAKLIESLGIKPGMVVADVGAGSGFHTFRIAPLVGETGKVIACDIQKEMLDLIRTRAEKAGVKNVERVQGTETDPKLPADSIDLILMVDVYHEFSHPYEMTEKMVAALKPGGRIAFVEFRLEDDAVPIKLVHKMSERQVILEMAEFQQMEHEKTYGKLPWQHVILFKKAVAKKP
jgi:ubiquinone/menaquinone biosynthesis C-methylase UbiE